ncbi:MAG: SUMF1/EgtB/PvdO family nonheme iron enzyme [Anaerolinea sp.]|nr:SUMF1/EgtB/PvdO family nonheme iron enzyme [Anaerolinea sp.]
MPGLHPTLHDEIVALLLPRRAFRLPDARLAELDPLLADWPGRHDLKWDVPPNEFCHSFVKNAPGAALQRALQETARQSGELDRADIARLCQQIDATLARKPDATDVPRPLITYYETLKTELSTGRYQLDRRFVQLTLLIDQGQDAQGLRFVADSQRGKYDSLQKLLAEVDDRALVLLGGPGSGKTTLLRRLQLEFAWDGAAGSADRVPFFIPLNAYRGARLADALPDPADWLAERWQAECRRAGQSGLPDFAALLREGRLLLLLDGLNEMPHRDREDYGERVAQWQLFVQDAPPGNTLLFSCRSLDYSVPLGSELTTVRQVQVEPLTPAQIEQFLVHYLADAADAVWAALRDDSQQLTLFATPFFLRLLVDQKLATGELLTSRVALLTGFVRRALYREIGERRHYLFAPGELLTANDGQQALHNRWATPLALPQQGLLIPKLEALAYGMQDGRAANEAAQVRIPEETAHALLNHPRAEEIVAAGIQLNVLDKELTRLEITYLHQLLQEYFAARVLARQPEPGRVQTAWRADEMPERLSDWLEKANVSDPLPAAPTTGWEETTLLAAAMTADQEQFVTDLMAANLPLATRCAAAPEVNVSPALVARLQEELLARIADPEADLRARIAAAEALADLGDPRFARRTGPHGEYLLPPTVPIPGGTYTIGADDSQYDAEKPAHPVQVDAFAMGAFPVTNAEYGLFMAAGGYNDERWWETEAARAWLKGEASTEGSKGYYREMVGQLQGIAEDAIQQLPNVTPDQVEPLLWLKHAAVEELEELLEKCFPTGKVVKQPELWDDSRFHHPSQPVVGVSWFEGRAYCAWLSAQTGNSYRLPNEAEWEAAARGQTRREYAYGSGYDAGRCNTFETQIRRTTPVGVFPGGQTPEGIADLSGNVWEWTSSQYRPYRYDPTDGRKDPEDAEARRVLRGGSFQFNADSARGRPSRPQSRRS